MHHGILRDKKQSCRCQGKGLSVILKSEKLLSFSLLSIFYMSILSRFSTLIIIFKYQVNWHIITSKR